MISNDFNTIEGKVVYIMVLMNIPFKVLGVSILIFYRLGWMSIILFGLIGIVIGFQILLGKLSADYQREVNVSKDKRIKIYTELLEGMRVIKLYGWETAFKKFIQEVRESEIISYIKMKLIKSFIYTTKEYSTYIAALICFFIMDKAGVTLTSAKILAALQPIMVLNDGLVFIGNGINMIFSL